MVSKYIFGFIAISAMLYMNNEPVSGQANFVKTAVSFKQAIPAARMRTVFSPVVGNSSVYAGNFVSRGRLSSSLASRYDSYAQKASFDGGSSEEKYAQIDLVMKIKSELFRLGCYRGRIDGVWSADLISDLEKVDRGLPTEEAEEVTLQYLKKQRTLGCDGNRAWDRLSAEENGEVGVTGSIQAAASSSEEILEKRAAHAAKLAVKKTRLTDSKGTKKSAVKKASLKKVADQKIALLIKKTKVKKAEKKRYKRRVARHVRKKFGTHSVFGIDSF